MPRQALASRAGPDLGRFVAAPAKINLALHVVGRRPDGYHVLDGLVAFADIGDRLSVTPADADRLTVSGPFASLVPAGADNLVLRALDLARACAALNGVAIGPTAIHLEKHLPVASGIGGGSADAAAILHHVGTAHPLLREALFAAAVTLGADVPMCLACRAVRSRGVGERLDDVVLPSLALVLANPLIQVPTPPVFAALTKRDNSALPAVPSGGFADVPALLTYLQACRNDLEAPAIALHPPIADVRDALVGSGSGLVRMSGSGATVFGAFLSEADARAAAATIVQARPDWWVVAARTISKRLGGADHAD